MKAGNRGTNYIGVGTGGARGAHAPQKFDLSVCNTQCSNATAIDRMTNAVR